MTRFDITTFGEGGLRLSVPVGHRIATADAFDLHIAGAEGNVVGALSNLGWRCGWVSGLPNTPMGQRVIREYKSVGIDVSAVVWQENTRVSVYYVEYSVPPRPTKVYFDRKNSCVNQLTIQDLDWAYLLDTKIVHLTGITVPLSDNCYSIVLEALKRAKKTDIITSYDVNFRSLLWTPTEAKQALFELFPYIDILFCSYGDAQTIFGYDGTPETVLRSLVENSDSSKIIMSIADQGVLGWDGQEIYHILAREVDILDRIGAGDALVSGVLHGLLRDDFVKGLSYGVTMSALAMSQYGDMVITTTAELEMLLSKDFNDIDR